MPTRSEHRCPLWIVQCCDECRYDADVEVAGYNDDSRRPSRTRRVRAVIARRCFLRSPGSRDEVGELRDRR